MTKYVDKMLLWNSKQLLRKLQKNFLMHRVHFLTVQGYSSLELYGRTFLLYLSILYVMEFGFGFVWWKVVWSG